MLSEIKWTYELKYHIFLYMKIPEFKWETK